MLIAVSSFISVAVEINTICKIQFYNNLKKMRCQHYYLTLLSFWCSYVLG